MVADVRLIAANPDEPNSGWNGEIPIFDMQGFTIKHLTKVVLSVLRIYMKYTQVNKINEEILLACTRAYYDDTCRCLAARITNSQDIQI